MSLYLGDNLVSGSHVCYDTRNIGQIVQSTIPLTDAGLHLLDGGLVLAGGIYDDFVQYIAGIYANHPELFTTEADWQTSVTNHGVCGKFVYTSSNGIAVSVRLPKITGFTEGAIDPTVIGTLTDAGLPNITGKAAMTKPGNSNNDPSVSGALYKTSGTNINDTVTNNGNGSDYYTLYLDASRVSSLYKNNFNKVQPQSIKVLYYIVIGTSTKTPVQVDLDEIATDLNGKCDVDGTNATFPHITETYSNGTSWYKVYSNGWCEQGGLTTSISTGGNVTITMLKVFVDTSYNLLISSNGAYYASAEANNTAVKNSSSQITISNGSHVSSQFSWEAKGYLY